MIALEMMKYTWNRVEVEAWNVEQVKC